MVEENLKDIYLNSTFNIYCTP